MVKTLISHTLPQFIQDHREQVVTAALDSLRRRGETASLLSARSEELVRWLDAIVAGVETWPAVATSEEQGLFQREFGILWFKHGVPLHEVVRALHVLKSKIVELARWQGGAQNALEIYIEEELEHRVSFFFDWLFYEVVLGYELAGTTPRTAIP